jgi:hypothetical protein
MDGPAAGQFARTIAGRPADTTPKIGGNSLLLDIFVEFQFRKRGECRRFLAG